MMFLCLILLLQHRDFIIGNRVDHNELATHFDKMIREHNVHKVLYEARSRFEEYLGVGWEVLWEELVRWSHPRMSRFFPFCSRFFRNCDLLEFE